MQANWQSLLKRWRDAELIDDATVERIRAFETSKVGTKDEAQGESGLRWPIILAIAFGCLAVGSGVLLYVASHWETMSPNGRFALVMLLVGGFHLLGALFSEKFYKLSMGLHGIGTTALGGGIALAGQIFNLQEHWPGGIMLWAIGAWLAYFVLRDWVQFALAAILTPAWLAGEWEVATTHHFIFSDQVLAQGMLLLAVTYLTAQTRELKSKERRAMEAIGAIAFLPCAIWTIIEAHDHYYWWWYRGGEMSTWTYVFGVLIGIGFPLMLAYILRGRAVWMNAVAALWIVILARLAYQVSWRMDSMPVHLWNILGACALTYWGIHDGEKKRVNLGVACFGLSIMAFYFSNVFDMLGRATALISLGVIFLLGGWFLEKTRRRLVAQAAVAGGQA